MKISAKIIRVSRVTEISIKNRTYHFFNDIIKIEHFDPNTIQTEKKSSKNILIDYIFYVPPKGDSRPLYLNNLNRYVEKSNGNKYLTQFFLLMKADTTWKRMKKYGAKLKTMLNLQIITQMIMMKNIWKSNSIQMMKKP